MRNVFCHSGDIGDCLASLPTMRALGGGDIIIGPPGPHQGRETLKGARIDALRPLLESQAYIGSVTWMDEPSGFSHDFRAFRQAPREYGETVSLLEWQARYLGATVSDAPWLRAVRSPVSLGRTVVARSLRYQNPGFPWHVAMSKNRNCVFVGLEDEYKAFSRTVSSAVEFVPTKDLLELAEVIGGAQLFIGNQSCPFWIAAGLGVPIIQESWPTDPNSQIKRPNARYLIRGNMTL